MIMTNDQEKRQPVEAELQRTQMLEIVNKDSSLINTFPQVKEKNKIFKKMKNLVK